MKIYTVRPGDTPAGIAGSCGLSPEELASYNALSDATRLSRGMALLLPDKGVEASPDETELLVLACPDVNRGILEKSAEYATFVCAYCAVILPDGALSAPQSSTVAGAAAACGALPLLAVCNCAEDTDGFSPKTAHRLFVDGETRERFLEHLDAELQGGGYMGALFHLHCLFPFDGEAYADFLTEASRFLHSRGFYMLASIAPRRTGAEMGISGSAQNYQAMCRCCDRLILLSGGLGGLGGPEAAMPRLREALDRAVELIAPGKLLMELPRRARDRAFAPQGGALSRSLSFATAADLAAALDAQPRYDTLLASTVFTYTDTEGREHRVWYEDARGLQDRLSLIKEYNLAGAALFCDNYLYSPTLKILGAMFCTEKLI